MFTINIILAVVILGLLYFLVLLPLIPLLKIKIQLGNKAILMFYPLAGLYWIFYSSGKKYQDVLKTLNDATIRNPNSVVILTNFIHKPLLIWTGKEYIKDMFIDHASYTKVDPFMIEQLAQKGLVLGEGDLWKRQRKFLANSFTFEKLTSRVAIINEVIDQVVKNENKTHLIEFISKISGQVIIRSFFGDLAKGFQLEGKEAQITICDITNKVFQLPIENPFIQLKQVLFEFKSWYIFPTQKEKILLRRVENFKSVTKNLIEKRIEQFKTQKLQIQDDSFFIDLYVIEYLKQQQHPENKQEIDVEEIIHQFLTFFFAGTDTTATTSLTSFYYLAKYPEMQNEILQEITEVVGETSEIKAEHLSKLVRINALIQEVLRLKNPAFAPLVRSVKKDKQLLDVKLKKGWFTFQYHIAPGLLDKHFENAQQFDYKRWLNKENIIQNDNGFIHIPFGAGPRMCIGQHLALIQLKMIIAKLVREYHIKFNPDVNQITFGMKFLYCIEPDNCLIFEERK